MPPQYIICSASHKIEDHYSGVAYYNKGKEKIYVHITTRCANCGGKHLANSSHCISRYKAEKKARKIKIGSNNKAIIVKPNDKPRKDE